MLLVLLTFKKQLDYYVFLFTAIAVSFVEELLYSTTNNNIYVEGKIMYNACIQKTKNIIFYFMRFLKRMQTLFLTFYFKHAQEHHT